MFFFLFFFYYVRIKEKKRFKLIIYDIRPFKLFPENFNLSSSCNIVKAINSQCMDK
jgi:hypothetical protein